MSDTGKTIALIKALGAKISPEDIQSAADSWLDENITNPDSPPLDRSLSSSSAAAPADIVGDLKNEIDDKQDAPATAGTAGQVLGLDSNLDPVWVNQQGGCGAVQDVQINGTSILSQGVANIIMNPVQNISGTTPSINAESGYRYICGECSTLTIVAPASGCIDVTFTSGSTPTVLSVSSAKTGVTAIKWANGFDPTSLDADTTYEINILDGEFGVVGSWT